ncbi:helix-turn-helix domain-containing protein [Gephyromycinifex aptenodytis]|uniref:helix-turn-helix domain-containing protein n=1 Tax=Gephyromycinifex aptenodytis TaxID=2716227 RepID=UPI001444F2DA|nr:helix-turn-helix domain-containing protein [Gephyromycinifex aptenodytis]
MASVEERLSALESAVARLSRAQESGTETGQAPVTPTGDFWLLNELLRRTPNGELAYAGHVELPAGPVRWQMSTDPEELLQADWHERASRLAALAHPVRLRLLQLVLGGVCTTAQLADDDGLGTTGQLHHHLRQLVAAGWLVSTGRGRYAVPPARVIPLLLTVAAAGE